MVEVQHPEIDDDYTVEGEWNRAMQALKAARDALQTLALVWEDQEKAGAVSGVVGTVEMAIDELEATNL